MAKKNDGLETGTAVNVKVPPWIKDGLDTSVERLSVVLGQTVTQAEIVASLLASFSESDLAEQIDRYDDGNRRIAAEARKRAMVAVDRAMKGRPQQK